eukprot:scaffold255563_cov35-Tisochrysis_lutea.AAC.2
MARGTKSHVIHGACTKTVLTRTSEADTAKSELLCVGASSRAVFPADSPSSGWRLLLVPSCRFS